MGQLVLRGEEAALCEIVGVRSFVRARALVARGGLVDVHRDPSGVIRGKVRGTGDAVTAQLIYGAGGVLHDLFSVCACDDDPECAHPAALAMMTLAERSQHEPEPPPPPKPDWELALSALVGADSPVVQKPDTAEVALQFALEDDETTGRTRIGLRPVVLGRKNWVRTGITWSTLDRAPAARSPRGRQRLNLLKELRALAEIEEADPYYGYYAARQRVIYLDEFRTRRLWNVLAEAQETGLPLVGYGKGTSTVRLVTQPVHQSVLADRVDGSLRLRSTLVEGDRPIEATYASAIGDPIHGLAWWGAPDQPGTLCLGPLDHAVTPEFLSTLGSAPILVPVSDEQRFLTQYYPNLARRTRVVPVGGSVALPELSPARLRLTVRGLPDHRMSLAWEWVRVAGSETQAEPLHSEPVADPERATTLRQATDLLADPSFNLTQTSIEGKQLRAHASISGDVMLRFARDLLPRLTEIDGLDVVVQLDDDAPEYVETDESPVVSFADASSSRSPGDWFDLAVQVTVESEEVGFEDLFVALASEQEFMILPSGHYFRLDQPEFDKLRELIAESRELEDTPPGVVRVGRFQAGLWDEIAELGEISGQAATWQESVRALSDAANGTVDVKVPAPQGLDASLRPYQLDGFRWLAALYRHRLGGVLADDMGLGKTLQTLALICHTVEQNADAAPFLVIAPASVVSNWAHEAARFAPKLTVTSIAETGTRRQESLKTAVAGANIVVTSYTLFRLEYDEYADLPWSGLILDEAQFVKNAQSQNYRCAKQLPVSFKLAITGTPMENNLAELWSMLSITAPGLMPRMEKFADYYRRPIEKESDQERLSQLRRRIRPLMLRRRKAEVVTELPAKQEHVVELDLNPKHRRMYQTYLQRERQKVLGLIGDLQKNRFEIFRSLTLLRQASLDLSLVDPKHHNIPSTKLDALVERVTDLAAEGHRVLVFSQFTRFLTTARERLEDAGIACVFLDGKTKGRAQVISEFKTGTAPAFLISLKSGGFGLNLTEADYCILLDPWWNPATEAQAVDRVHRIGQTRNVMVYRLVAKDTIEEKVMALKARKAALFSSVLDGGEFASADLTASDIQELLG